MSTREPRGWMSVETSVEGGYVSKHDPEVRFKEWTRQVNQHVIKICGMSANDLEDCPYRDWFDSGMKPDRAARAAIKRAGAF